MTLYTVYRQSEFIKYYSNFFSRSTVFVFLFTLVPLFVSLVSAYRSYGFYQSTKVRMVQPKVNLLPDMFIQFTGTGISQKWSTIQDLSTVLPALAVYEKDSNYDKTKESLKMTIKIANNNIKSVNILLQFSYLIQDISTFEIRQPLIITVDGGPNTFQKADFVASLSFVQQSLIPYKGSFGKYNFTLFNSSASKTVLDAPFKAASDFIQKRNFTISWDGPISSMSQIAGQSFTEINLNILYSPVEIMFHSTFWGLIKWAWVQWFYYLVIYMWAFQAFKEFAFDSNAVPGLKRNTIWKPKDSTNRLESKKFVTDL